MWSIEYQVVADAAYEVDLMPDEAIRAAYSGRGAYGEPCFGLVASINDAVKVLIEIGVMCPKLAKDLADIMRTDNLGYDTIVYFPGYELVNVPELV